MISFGDLNTGMSHWIYNSNFMIKLDDHFKIGKPTKEANFRQKME